MLYRVPAETFEILHNPLVSARFAQILRRVEESTRFTDTVEPALRLVICEMQQATSSEIPFPTSGISTSTTTNSQTIQKYSSPHRNQGALQDPSKCWGWLRNIIFRNNRRGTVPFIQFRPLWSRISPSIRISSNARASLQIFNLLVNFARPNCASKVSVDLNRFYHSGIVHVIQGFSSPFFLIEEIIFIDFFLKNYHNVGKRGLWCFVKPMKLYWRCEEKKQLALKWC